MAAVIGALAPVSMLIALGVVLRRTLLADDSHWVGLERITYYVLFPALLIVTLARAELDRVPVFDVGAALMIAVLVTSALCFALNPLLRAAGNVSGSASTSVFQGATRFQTYIALSVVGALYGSLGLTLASVATVAMVPMLNVLSVAVLTHYAARERRAPLKVALDIARNPLIWACAVGILLSLLHVTVPAPLFQFGDALGKASLAVGLLVTGAGLKLGDLWRPNVAATTAIVLKLIAMPVFAGALGLAFRLSGSQLAVVICCAAVPTSPSAYVLARQMGGDAPLLAQIISYQTVLAALTMPVALGFAGWLAP